MPVEGWSGQNINDPVNASRGQLATALFEALGITSPSSKDKFGDAGYLGGVASTLADIGITNGVGENTFGTAQDTTRGQAFTMIARMLGLADADTSIEEASRALVTAGIVKGYGDNPNNLGLNDPLSPEHLGLLMERVGPELDRVDPDTSLSLRDTIAGKVDSARNDNLMSKDPAFAAFLQSQGVARGEVDDEIALRKSLFLEDAKKRSDSYGRESVKANRGISQDFENRGLSSSGTNALFQTRQSADSLARLGDADHAAQREMEEGNRVLGREGNAIDRATDEARRRAEAQLASGEIEQEFA